MVSIWEKETIFEAYEKAVQDGVQKPIAHVAQLGLPGYFPGCLYASKWGTVRESQNWSLLCKTAPALCKKHKELPNSLRRIMMIEAVKHGNSTGTEARTHLPMPLQEVVDELVLQRIELGEEVNMAYVKNTIHFAVEIWNEVVVSIKDSFQKKQMDLIKRDDEKLAGMTPAELEQHCDALVSEGEKMLEPICLKQSEGAILKKAQRLCGAFGIRSRANEKPGAHLPFGHPALQEVRTYVSKTCKDKGICPRLVANFDQVWTTLFRPERKILQKSTPAGLKDPLVRSMAMRRVRHNLQRCLGLEFTETDPGVLTAKESLKQPRVSGGPAASATVDSWRQPRTLTTLSFIDGHLGRAYITCKAGTIAESTRKQMNKELSKYLWIAEPQEKTHIWNQASLVHYLHFLAQEFRQRRRELGVDASARGLVMMDQAGAHMSDAYTQIQKKWSEQHNIEILCGHSEIPIPGGFGAAGGPNDAWHQALHSLTKAYLRMAIGWGSAPMLRKRHNKIIWLGWLQRGYCSVDEIAQWLYNGDTRRVEELMQRTRGSMDAICSLCDLPDIDAEDPEIEHMRLTELAGEKQFLWALESGDHRLPLPDWIGNVLEMRVCQFISEHDNWESKIQKRSLTGKMLIRSQQQKYELWKLNLDQKLVFAKDEKVLVSEAKKVNKNCILLNLHLSAVPQELSVSAADGAKYRLLLLSGQPSKEVPSLPTQLDHPAPPNVIGEPVEEDDEEASDRESHPGQNDEMHAREMDEEQEMMEVDESEPEFAVLADSDDDIENFSGVQTIEQQSAVKKQWQAMYPNPSPAITMSAIWGGTSKRTEEEALLRAIKGLLQNHCAQNPKDMMWRGQLNRVLDAEATRSF
ncbi:Malate dehydrogenase 2 [Durusdinium trenchii]|uniref:Mitochondrial n=1 Tax=Durusdinium trenchii TaxID=1381693 RepID=A0ABP0MUQ1_9DINO